jgi:Xaa-Pro aminopeptidase
MLGFLLGIGVTWLGWAAVVAGTRALSRPSARRRERREALREALRAAVAAREPRHA